MILQGALCIAVEVFQIIPMLMIMTVFALYLPTYRGLIQLFCSTYRYTSKTKYQVNFLLQLHCILHVPTSYRFQSSTFINVSILCPDSVPPQPDFDRTLRDATSIDMHGRSAEAGGRSTGIVNQVACIKIIRI